MKERHLPRNIRILNSVRHPEFCERFWAKVKKGPDCWEWQAAKNPKGYGKSGLFMYRGTALAHRVAWIAYHKEAFPDHLCLLHKCDNPSCVNPSHLRLGTRVDNNLDMHRKGREARGEARKSKLTSEDVLEIRASTLHPTELADKYGVCWRHIYRIRARQLWTHI